MQRATGFIQRNFDIFTLASVDFTTTFLLDIDLLAKSITSVLILLIAVRRFLKRDSKKDIEKIRKEIKEEIKKEFGISEDKKQQSK